MLSFRNHFLLCHLKIYPLADITLDYKLDFKIGRGFPGGAVVKNPPANAGDTGSCPGPGRSQCAAEQLSPCATTTEPAL